MTDHAAPLALPMAPAASPATILAAHLQKRQSLAVGAATRTANLGTSVARLFAAGRGAEAITEMFAVQAAVRQRMVDQQRAFAEGMQALAQQWRQLPSANNLTNLTTQEANLSAQYGLLLTAQFTALLEVMEGVTVGYGYWADQQHAEAKSGRGTPGA